MFVWVALKDNAKQAKKLWTITEICLNPGFQLDVKMNFSENTKQTFHLGLMIWKVMRGNVWKDIANLQINQFKNYTMSQLHVLTTMNSEKKDLLENCQKYALKLFSNACTWLQLVDLVFRGQ